MLEFFNGLSKREKILFAVGGGAVVLFVWQPWKSSEDNAGGYQVISSGVSSPTPDNSTQTAAAINTMLQSHADQMNASTTENFAALNDVLTGIVSANQAANATLSQQIGRLETVRETTTQPQQPVTYQEEVYEVFGASVDLLSAMEKFGNGSNVHYTNTEGMSAAQVHSMILGAPGAIVAGGAGAVGGVTDAALAGTGAVRAGGADREQTKLELAKIRLN